MPVRAPASRLRAALTTRARPPVDGAPLAEPTAPSRPTLTPPGRPGPAPALTPVSGRSPGAPAAPAGTSPQPCRVPEPSRVPEPTHSAGRRTSAASRRRIAALTPSVRPAGPAASHPSGSDPTGSVSGPAASGSAGSSPTRFRNQAGPGRAAAGCGGSSIRRPATPTAPPVLPTATRHTSRRPRPRTCSWNLAWRIQVARAEQRKQPDPVPALRSHEGPLGQA
jgi:hypothetical protein